MPLLLFKYQENKKVFNFCANAIGVSENVAKVSILSTFLQHEMRKNAS